MQRTLILAGGLAVLAASGCRSDDTPKTEELASRRAGTLGTAQTNFDDQRDSYGTQEASYRYGDHGGWYDGSSKHGAPTKAGTGGTSQTDYDGMHDSYGTHGGMVMSGEHGHTDCAAGTAGTSAIGGSNEVGRGTQGSGQNYAAGAYGSGAGDRERVAGTQGTAQRDYDFERDSRPERDLRSRVGLAEASSPRSARDPEAVIASWPEASQKAARATIRAYGPPAQVGERELEWHDKGPWKEIAVRRDPVPHAFPMPHEDVLMQKVALSVPEDKVDDLAAFDGSLTVDRTAGTVAATCDREEMNIAAINLAKDIIDGRRDVAQAREQIAQVAREVKGGNVPPVAQRLSFQPTAAGNPGAIHSTELDRDASGVTTQGQKSDQGDDQDAVEPEHPKQPHLDPKPDNGPDVGTPKDDGPDGG